FRKLPHTADMTTLRRSTSIRWAAPGVVLLLLAGGTALQPAIAAAGTDAPPLTAEELLVKLHDAKPVPLHGTVNQRLELGLPDLPAAMTGRSGSASLASLVSGTHTWQVWYGDKQQQRLALMDGANESDIYRDGTDVWLWSSAEQTATHYLMPDPATMSHPTSPHQMSPHPMSPSGAPGTAHTGDASLPDFRDPSAAATWALAQLDTTTTVTTTNTEKVAGRTAYGLVLTPKASNTRVASVRIALDAATFVPLKVTVMSTQQEAPAVDVGFTEFDAAEQDAATFRFTPPPGAEVSTKDLTTTMPATKAPANPTTQLKRHMAAADAHQPTVTGTGWGAVASGRLPADAMTAGQDGKGGQKGQKGKDGKGADQTNSPSQALALLPRVSGTWGSGRLLDGTLVSAVVTDDGRYAIGAVDPADLYAALPQRS
ncbi:MAG: hypothetical protein ABI746_13605, partial [Dermatophilaceae bacterium]